MNRTSNISFTQQDVDHLGVLCAHLGQVVTHIFERGLLGLFSETQTELLTRFVNVLHHKHRGHM
jgi:hypothetical protein